MGAYKNSIRTFRSELHVIPSLFNIHGKIVRELKMFLVERGLCRVFIFTGAFIKSENLPFARQIVLPDCRASTFCEFR